MAWCNAPDVRLPRIAGAPGRTGYVRAGRGGVPAAALFALALGACDFPTEPPIFESRFIIPAEQTTLPIAELLPPQVTVAGDAFALVLPDTQVTRSLAQLCGAPCALIPAGTPISPKPAFTQDIDFTLHFPADVQAVVVASGRVRLELSHDFGFDVLASGGYIRTVITSNGRRLASDSVGGPFTGATLVRDLQLDPGTVGGDLVGTVTLHSPLQAGPVVYQPNASFTVRVRPGVPAPVLISQATVRRPADVVSVTDLELDLTDIDDETATRARSGTLVFEIANPFAVGGTLQLEVFGPGGRIASRQVVIPPCDTGFTCTTAQRITPEFTTSEIRSMLGSNLRLSVAGQLSTGDSFVTIYAGQQLEIDTQLDLVLRIGGDE